MNYWGDNLAQLSESQPEDLPWFLNGAQRLQEGFPLNLVRAKEDYTITYNSAGEIRHLYSKYRPRDTKALIKRHAGTGSSIIWLGVGLGYEFMKWYTDNQVSQKIFIIEAEPAMVAAFLTLHDLTALLDSNQLTFVVHDEQRILLEGEIYENQRITKYWYGFYGQVLLDLCPAVDEYKVVIMKHVTFAHDLVKSAEDLGWEVLELDWQDEGNLGMMIAEFRPKFVLTINISEMMQRICSKLGIPYRTWTVDIPAYNFFEEQNNSTISWHFTADSEAAQKAKTLGFSNVKYLPPASMIRNVNREIDSKWSFLKDYAVLVGNTGFFGEYHKLKTMLSARCLQELEALIEVQNRDESFCLPALVRQFAHKHEELWQEVVDKWGIGSSPGFAREEKLAYFLGKESTGRIRRGLVEELVKNNKVAVFGDEGWLFLEGTKNFLYGGFVNHYNDVPIIYKEAGVNINLTRPYAVGKVIPVRVMDALSVGGFLISNMDSSLLKFFEPGVHMVLAPTNKIPELTNLWLQKPQAQRRQIAEQGQKVIVEQHLLDYRWSVITESLKKGCTTHENCCSYSSANDFY